MFLLVSGVFNNFAKLALPVLALALVALQGNPSGGRVAAGLLGIGVRSRSARAGSPSSRSR